MKTYLSLFFILLLSTSFAQGILQPGIALREENKYDESIRYYLKQKKEGHWDWGNKYNYAKVLALAGQIDSCFSYLNENIKERISIQSLTDIEFIGIKEDKRWTVYEQNVINNHLPCKDVALSAQIYRAIALSEKDENNIELLFDLINKNGWPKTSQVGDASKYIFGSLGQNDLFLTQVEKYLIELKQLCIKGEVNCEDFASTYDLIQNKANKPQKYGTIFEIDYHNNNKRIYYKLLNENKVNKWRAAIGLEKLK